VRNFLALGFGLGAVALLVEGCGSRESSANKQGSSSTGGSSDADGSTGGQAGGGGSSGSSTGRSGAPGSGGASGGGGSGNTGGKSAGGAAGAAGSVAQDGGGQPDAGCPTGFSDCDGDPANGCEQSLDDVANCGACAHLCSAQNGTVTCESQACKVTACTGNFGDCDGNADNGCEASLTSDDNCGTCGRDCTIDGATCSSGLCGTVQLFSATDMPFGTDNAGARSWAFDAATNSAFWVGFNSYSVRRFPFDGSAASVVYQPVSAATAGTESIAVTGGNVYWSIGGSPATVFEKAVGAAASVNPTQAFFPVARASFCECRGARSTGSAATIRIPLPSRPLTSATSTRAPSLRRNRTKARRS
jgi:hypothetical protein